MPIEIRTDRLLLRRPVMVDVHDVHAIFSDAEALTYWSSGPHQSLAETEDWLRASVEDEENAAWDLFIEHEGRIIGKLGCWRLPEIGYILHRDWCGLGIAREALAAFIKVIGEHRPCDHLWADVDPRNHRSKQLLLACGFHHVEFRERTMETHIGWCDSDYFRRDL